MLKVYLLYDHWKVMFEIICSDNEGMFCCRSQMIKPEFNVYLHHEMLKIELGRLGILDVR